ncbi:MAG: nucleotidyltransferase family protein [Burkholderiales bacterium]|mgnify:CR=1 FL=1|nr:nucleotidyltransferase family protein [Burkholderiales bacterium]OJX03744.1 MAG: hypothetical protein BGO72_02265 [Burkholderiales bacterium 70-64]
MSDIVPARDPARGIGAVLLAAGRSVRMGGPNKLLIPVAGEPMVRRALCVLQAVPLAPVVVVLGREPQAVRAALAGLPACTMCEVPEGADQQVSVDAGLRVLPEGLDAVLIMLSDQPLLDADDLRWLVARWRGLPAGSAAIPEFGGQRGNPVVVDGSMRAPILAAGPDTGCRGYLAANPQRVHRVTAPNDHFVVDIDTAEDLARLAGRGVRVGGEGAGT